jgi:hypothetical protein
MTDSNPFEIVTLRTVYGDSPVMAAAMPNPIQFVASVRQFEY